MFLFLHLNRREILRFAQNVRTRPFFRSLFSLRVFCMETEKAILGKIKWKSTD